MNLNDKELKIKVSLRCCQCKQKHGLPHEKADENGEPIRLAADYCSCGHDMENCRTCEWGYRKIPNPYYGWRST